MAPKHRRSNIPVEEDKIKYKKIYKEAESAKHAKEDENDILGKNIPNVVVFICGE